MGGVKKIIIDTDTGIDDAMAIFVALQSPEIEVVGLTTIYGNVYTTLSTRNALHLLEVAGRTDIPVAEGSHVTVTAIQLDPEFPKKIGQIVILGGAFAVNGNAIPASEANIFGDPDAADTMWNRHCCYGNKYADRNKLAESTGKFAQYLTKILEVYCSYHHNSYNTQVVYLHDPTALIAAFKPSLLMYTEGVVRVQTNGIMRGLTIFDNTNKRFGELTEWNDKPTVKVAVIVDAPAIVKLVMDRLINS